jgi:hypothetical protein
VKQKKEHATRFDQAIAKMRASGLSVTDKTKKGALIGISGVHKHGDGVARHGIEAQRSEENLKQYSEKSGNPGYGPKKAAPKSG